MKKPKPAPDFHLSCNCFLQLQKRLSGQGANLLGLMMYNDKLGNSGLGFPFLTRLINPDGSRQQGMIPLNYCPFCGRKISVSEGEKDENVSSVMD